MFEILMYHTDSHVFINASRINNNNNSSSSHFRLFVSIFLLSFSLAMYRFLFTIKFCFGTDCQIINLTIQYVYIVTIQLLLFVESHDCLFWYIYLYIGKD